MTDHKVYRDIKNERRRGVKRTLIRKPGVKGSWEKARAKFSKNREDREMEDQCVCSHSKWQHRPLGEHWGKCEFQEDCGCELYKKMEW